MDHIPWTRRQFMAASGAIAGSAIVAGCGSSSGDKGGGGSGAGKLTEVKGKAAPELKAAPKPADLVGGPTWKAPDLSGKTLTMWGLNYAPHVDRYHRLADKFNELTGATVKVQPQDDPQKQILAALAGGNVPDVLCLMGKMSDQLVKQKALLAVDDVVYSDLKIDMDKWWMPDAIQAYYFTDQKHYGVPAESNAHATVACRTDLITAAGADAEALWPGSVDESKWPNEGVWFDSYDDLYQLAGMLQQKGGSKVKVWGMNRQGWELESLTSIMYQLGTFWWDTDEQKFNLDNDACVQALELMVATPYQKKIESKLAVGNVVNAFVAKQVALAVGNDSAVGEGAKIKIPGENVIQPSAVKGQEPVFVGEGGWGFEIPIQSKNQDLATEFLRFMTTYDAQFIWSQIYGGMAPACRALVDSAIYKGNTPVKRGQRRALIALGKTRYQGHGYDPQTETMMTAVIDNMRAGKVKPKEASSQLQDQLTQQLQRYKGQ